LRTNIYRQIVLILGVVSISWMGIGCSGAARRNASETLHKAITASRTQIQEAQALLSNPVIGEVGVAEALALSDAQSVLEATQSALVKSIARASEGENTAFDADLGEASMTLGMIQNIRGTCYQRMFYGNVMAMRSALREARLTVSKMRTVAGEMYRPVESMKLLAQRPVNVAAMKAMLAEETENIRTAKNAIAANLKASEKLRTKRDAMRTKSEQLKIDSSRLRDPEATKVLNKALALSNKADAVEKEMSILIRKGVEWVSVLVEATTGQSYASLSLKDLDELEKGQASAMAGNKKRLERYLFELKTMQGTLSEYVKIAEERATSASKFAKQGEGLYEQAIQTSKQAEGLLGSVGRAQCLAAQSAIEAQSGDLYRTSAVVAGEIQQFQKSLASTWKLVPYKTLDPLSAVELTAFVEANQNALELAIQRFNGAIEKQKEALGLCDESNRWSFRWSLLAQQHNAASAMELAGQSGELLIQEVRRDLPQLEQEAEMAGRGQDIRTLRRMLGVK
jgi:tetratricopeptide (TPR) repeat protein